MCFSPNSHNKQGTGSDSVLCKVETIVHWVPLALIIIISRPVTELTVCDCVCVSQTKEEVASTLEAVQNIQTISQALQKSKENYNAKTVEQERLRKEGATQRDVDKVGGHTRTYSTHTR